MAPPTSESDFLCSSYILSLQRIRRLPRSCFFRLSLWGIIPLIRHSQNRRFVQFPATAMAALPAASFIPAVSFSSCPFLHYLPATALSLLSSYLSCSPTSMIKITSFHMYVNTEWSQATWGVLQVLPISIFTFLLPRIFQQDVKNEIQNKFPRVQTKVQTKEEYGHEKKKNITGRSLF